LDLYQGALSHVALRLRKRPLKMVTSIGVHTAFEIALLVQALIFSPINY
jgi:hypothetical protein